MSSSIVRRSIQLRLAMAVGCDAIGTKAPMYPGYCSPHSHVCIPPIELPMTRANMAHAETFGEQAVLRLDHVGIVVFREFRFQPVGRLCAFAVTDAVRDDDVV